MKLMLDSRIPAEAAEILRKGGHDVFWAGSLIEPIGEEEALELAYNESRLFITCDGEFGESLLRHGCSHAGVLRLVLQEPFGSLGMSIRKLLRRYGGELANRSVLTVHTRTITLHSYFPQRASNAGEE